MEESFRILKKRREREIISKTSERKSLNRSDRPDQKPENDNDMYKKIRGFDKLSGGPNDPERTLVMTRERFFHRRIFKTVQRNANDVAFHENKPQIH